MNGASTSIGLTDASVSDSGAGGELSGGLVCDQEREVATACGSTASSANPDVEIGEDVAEATADGFQRVDSLTLALEAIKVRQAAAATYLGSPSGGVDSVSNVSGVGVVGSVGGVVFRVSAAPDPDSELGSLANSNSPDPISGSGSSAGEEDLRPKRASSLRLPRRPSAAEQPKKAVRFADALGLDLTLVRQVFDLESPPVIPPQAMRDLVLPPSDDEFSSSDEDGTKVSANKNTGDKDSTERPGQHPSQHLYLSPSFAQPGSAPNFYSRVSAQKVVLEKAYYHMATPSLTSVGHVRGLVRVANLGFEKSVRVRATFDAWQHCTEVGTDFQPGGSCGNSDQFAFSVAIQPELKVGDKVAFCVVYSVNGQTYWDNNFGDNYSFHCVAINSSHGLSSDQEHALARYI